MHPISAFFHKIQKVKKWTSHCEPVDWKRTWSMDVRLSIHWHRVASRRLKLDPVPCQMNRFVRDPAPPRFRTQRLWFSSFAFLSVAASFRLANKTMWRENAPSGRLQMKLKSISEFLNCLYSELQQFDPVKRSVGKSQDFAKWVADRNRFSEFTVERFDRFRRSQNPNCRDFQELSNAVCLAKIGKILRMLAIFKRRHSS